MSNCQNFASKRAKNVHPPSVYIKSQHHYVSSEELFEIPKASLPVVLFVVGVVWYYKNIPTCFLLLNLHKKVGQHYWSCTIYADCSRKSIKANADTHAGVFICIMPLNKLKAKWDNMQIVKWLRLMWRRLCRSVWSHIKLIVSQEAPSVSNEGKASPRPLKFGASSPSYLSFLSGSGGHSAQMTSYSDSGYQDSSISYYSNQNVVRSEPRASLSRSPRAEGQASGQVGMNSTMSHSQFDIFKGALQSIFDCSPLAEFATIIYK